MSERGAWPRARASRVGPLEQFLTLHRRSLTGSLVFAVCGGVFAFLIAWLMGSQEAMAALQGGIARIVSAILNLLGNETRVVGTTVASAQFGISVVTACTGVFMTAAFVAAVIAYPSRLRAKLVGAGLGTAAIFALNVIRLVSLFYVGVYLPRFLEPAHLLVWQSLLIVFVVGLWLFWAGRVAHAPRRS